jgi:hypothetical protein
MSMPVRRLTFEIRDVGLFPLSNFWKAKPGVSSITNQSTTGGRGPLPPPKKQLWKTMEIRPNARKNQEHSGRFFRKYAKFWSFHYNSLQNFGQTFDCPPESISPVRPCIYVVKGFIFFCLCLTGVYRWRPSRWATFVDGWLQMWNRHRGINRWRFDNNRNHSHWTSE